MKASVATRLKNCFLLRFCCHQVPSHNHGGQDTVTLELFENDSITKPSSGQKMSKAPILWPDKDLGAKSEAIRILKQIEAKQKLALS